MSLRDSVLYICEQMEKGIEELNLPDSLAAKILLKSYSQQLRVALKASEREDSITSSIQAESPVHDHRYYIELEKEKMRKEKQKLLQAEREELQSYIIAQTGEALQAQAEMPVGAKIFGPNNKVLELKEDGQLHYVD